MAVTPNSVVTAQGVKTAQAFATAAKTTYNDNANAVLLLTAGANGGVLYGVKALPRANVTASQLQLYSSPDGVAMSFIGSAVLAAYNFADTTAPTPADFGFTETNVRRLAPNERIYCATRVALAGGIVFDAQYEDL
jgi:hypothetical protein